jgi:hypothetical protein
MQLYSCQLREQCIYKRYIELQNLQYSSNLMEETYISRLDLQFVFSFSKIHIRDLGLRFCRYQTQDTRDSSAYSTPGPPRPINNRLYRRRIINKNNKDESLFHSVLRLDPEN